jgi:hypothetical protein
MDTEIGMVGSEKTNTQAIKIGIREWKGRTGVDIRRHFKMGADWAPTTKGVWLQINEVKEAITLLERAEAELTKRGLYGKTKP